MVYKLRESRMPGIVSGLWDELEMVSKIPAKHPLKKRLCIVSTIHFGECPIFDRIGKYGLNC
jgi:hypothetical protein